jgi:hypothetical protein
VSLAFLNFLKYIYLIDHKLTVLLSPLLAMLHKYDVNISTRCWNLSLHRHRKSIVRVPSTSISLKAHSIQIVLLSKIVLDLQLF